MLLPAPIKRLGFLFRGRVSPPLAGICVGLGWWLGFIPGFGGPHILLVIAGLVLNIPLGAFTTSAVLGRTCALLSAPVLYHTGRILNEHAGWICKTLRQIPIIALADLDRPAVVGGMAIAPWLAILLGIGMATAVYRFRRLWLTVEGRSERVRLLQSRWYIRFLEWLIIGPRAPDARTALSVKTRYIRWWGVVVLAIMAGGILAANWLGGSEFLRARIERALTYANGATVDVQRLDLSLLAGRAGIEGLAIADAQRPTHNGLEVASAQLKVDPYQLLLGRLVVDRLEARDVGLDRPRATPAQVVQQAEGRTWHLPKIDLDISTLANLDRYLQDANKVRTWLQRISPYLPSGQPPSQIVPQRYLEYLSATQPTPRVRCLIRQAQLDQIHLPGPLFGATQIRVTNLSERPYLVGLPTDLILEGQMGPRLQLRINWGQQSAQLDGIIEGFDLGRLQSVLRPDNPLRFDAGNVAGTLKGTVSAQAIDLQVDLAITHLKASVTQGLLGLDSKTANELFSGLSRLEVPMWIRGPIDDPRIGFDTKRLQESLKKVLIEQGKQKAIEQLQRKVEKELGGRLPAGVGDLLGPAIDKAGLGGILRMPKDQNTP
ncbi:MAG: hypothetical protein QHH07_12510 [Sedimentisphaerales bacterium]|nr:hypothetical protein [Sedimentisphaerales bacterium]